MRQEIGPHYMVGVDVIAHVLAHVAEVVPQNASVICGYSLHLCQALVRQEAQLLLLLLVVLSLLRQHIRESEGLVTGKSLLEVLDLSFILEAAEGPRAPLGRIAQLKQLLLPLNQTLLHLDELVVHCIS